MSIDIVAEFFLGNKHEAHQTDMSSQEAPSVIPYVSTRTENPDKIRARRNIFAIKAQKTSKVT